MPFAEHMLSSWTFSLEMLQNVLQTLLTMFQRSESKSCIFFSSIILEILSFCLDKLARLTVIWGRHCCLILSVYSYYQSSAANQASSLCHKQVVKTVHLSIYLSVQISIYLSRYNHLSRWSRLLRC